jgi:hypothetical protein
MVAGAAARLIGRIDPAMRAGVRGAEEVGLRFERHHVDEHGPCAIDARSRVDSGGFAAVRGHPAATS